MFVDMRDPLKHPHHSLVAGRSLVWAMSQSWVRRSNIPKTIPLNKCPPFGETVYVMLSWSGKLVLSDDDALNDAPNAAFFTMRTADV